MLCAIVRFRLTLHDSAFKAPPRFIENYSRDSSGRLNRLVMNVLFVHDEHWCQNLERTERIASYV